MEMMRNVHSSNALNRLTTALRFRSICIRTSPFTSEFWWCTSARADFSDSCHWFILLLIGWFWSPLNSTLVSIRAPFCDRHKVPLQLSVQRARGRWSVKGSSRNGAILPSSLPRPLLGLLTCKRKCWVGTVIDMAFRMFRSLDRLVIKEFQQRLRYPIIIEWTSLHIDESIPWLPFPTLVVSHMLLSSESRPSGQLQNTIGMCWSCNWTIGHQAWF